MSIALKIAEELQQAQKAKNELVVSALRVLRAEMLNSAIAKMKKELSDEEAIGVIKSQVKRLREAVVDFERGGRSDLAEKNQKEIGVLEKYLPAGISEDEIRKEVQTVISAGSYKTADFGKAMKEVMAKLKGKADGAVVSRILKETLK
ncbi:GatB/YqeY domain-containing protein [Candidatus Uhrbacteria bacterium]|nr:GatB/YqeY domain-containing protein [Candidatus Uhrbacteria bacterium]